MGPVWPFFLQHRYHTVCRYWTKGQAQNRTQAQKRALGPKRARAQKGPGPQKGPRAQKGLWAQKGPRALKKALRWGPWGPMEPYCPFVEPYWPLVDLRVWLFFLPYRQGPTGPKGSKFGSILNPGPQKEPIVGPGPKFGSQGTIFFGVFEPIFHLVWIVQHQSYP